ncbi:hypothetical protein CFAM422_007752 [Trichoderma lentiforme]|uniref:Uncharacterized protein n=1 Tax=Trichoderma lentiforme TaxID=1567552 RepID=A0A9P4XAX0_9HYPO|nr:hypothetical protein CFAM422_007752 [Trichoderma lentiforme]
MARFPKYPRIKNYLLLPPRPNRIRVQEYYTDHRSIVRENPTEIERISIALQASQANDQTDKRTSERAKKRTGTSWVRRRSDERFIRDTGDINSGARESKKDEAENAT